ncbi:MAG: pectate lyase [Pirellula sp.]|nr:pectate lyase [Pirellula sp.]
MPILNLIARVICFFGLLISFAPAAENSESARAMLAFPGAEGFGRHSLGGRGGKVYFVTTLADYNPKAKKNTPIEGSLRHGLSLAGPRTIVFRTSGVIELLAPLKIAEPRVTIAGQTAPGDGICITNFGTQIEADDVVVRHVRFRPGDSVGKEMDALAVYQCRHVILDHCSASWSIDETLSVTGEGCGDVTVQWCFITESLDQSVHAKGTHGYGSLIRTDGGVTYHHNLYAHHRTRCPRPGTYGKPPGLLLDFRNNVVYDWISPAGYSAEDPARINYVGNYLKPGPSTTDRVYMFDIGGAATQMFAAGNKLDYAKLRGPDDWDWIEHAERASKLSEALASAPVTTDSAEQARDRVLAGGGATRPRRDAIDLRIVGEVRSGGGKVINSPKDVGGLPSFTATEVPADADSDGLPDAWEAEHGLNASDAADQALDADGDGYTNLEEWLNATDPRRAEAANGS